MNLPRSVLSNIDPKGYFGGLAKNLAEIIILLDPIEFKIRYINHLQGDYKTENVLDVPVFNFLSPDHIENYREKLMECVKFKKTLTIELEGKSKISESGKAWYRSTFTPMCNLNGEIENIIIVSTDISLERHREIENKNKQEKLYAIINNTSDIILSIDKDLNLTEYNSVFGAQIERGFGKVDLIGSPVLNYINPHKHDHLKKIYDKVFNGEVITDIENFKQSNSENLYYETNYNPIYNYEKKIIGISCFSKNITDRFLNDQKTNKALKDKDVLLSEIHHRIKNNLALVSSMLQLKEMNLENPEAKEALKDSRKRIKSTALVHEMLYRNDSFDNIKLMEYVKELFNNLNSDPNITIDLAGEDHILGIEKALPFGLMLHELMMNSFKHSFKGGEKSILKIRSSVNNENLNIEYCDCRGKFPDNFNFNNTNTTGLMLIHTFIEQLNGTIHLLSQEPPSYSINIPLI